MKPTATSSPTQDSPQHREPFAMTPLDLLAHPDVTSDAKVLYGWLHGRYSGLPAGITAGVPRMAADLGWPTRRVDRALASLRSVGAIKRRRRPGTSSTTVLVWHESRRRLRVVPDPVTPPPSRPVTPPASCKPERASQREEDQDQEQDPRSTAVDVDAPDPLDRYADNPFVLGAKIAQRGLDPASEIHDRYGLNTREARAAWAAYRDQIPAEHIPGSAGGAGTVRAPFAGSPRGAGSTTTVRPTPARRPSGGRTTPTTEEQPA